MTKEALKAAFAAGLRTGASFPRANPLFYNDQFEEWFAEVTAQASRVDVGIPEKKS